jgi:uncharacterized protein YneF (UPF0154 family)
MEIVVLILSCILSVGVGFFLGTYYVFRIQKKQQRKMEEQGRYVGEQIAKHFFAHSVPGNVSLEDRIAELERAKVQAIKDDEFEQANLLDKEIEAVKKQIK